MKESLLKRIPRIPHWRYVLWAGEDHPDYSEEMRSLARYIKEEGMSVGLKLLDEPDDDMERAMRMYEEPPFRKVVESMLMENCPYGLIVDAIFHKFKESLDNRVIRLYKKYFFDTEVANSYDIVRMYERNSVSIPKPPPVPGSMKEAYMAFKNGVNFDLNLEEVMMHMFAESFFRSQELKELGWQADDKVIKLRKNAMDIMKMLQDGNMEVVMPEKFNYEVEYPEKTAVTLDELNEGYDPADDPNDLAIPDD